MKKTIPLLILPLLFVNYSYSQQNLHKPSNDTDIASGTFYDPISNNIITMDYLKHFMTVKLKVDRIADSIYMSDFYNFLKIQNAILRNPAEIYRYGLVTVRLSDTSNTIYYVKRFYDFDLFEYVYPSGFGKQE